ncbi:MAG: sulfotransferase [Magnetococcales bacterium]|nr:sulfotransferase [Magnetococcales bacterium]
MIIQRIKQKILYLPRSLDNRKMGGLAVRLCHLFLRFRPHHPELIHQLVNILSQRDQIGVVIRLLNRYLQQNPNDPYLHINLGNAFLSCQRLEDAIKCYRKALSIQPNAVGALVNLGNALNQLGRVDGAIDCYEKVIALKPDFAKGYHSIGIILLLDSQPERAVEYFAKACQLNPKMAFSHIHMGQALIELGRFKEAEESLLQGLNLDDDNAGVYSSLSQLDSNKKNSSLLNNMESLLKKSIFLPNDQILMYFSLARGYMGQGEKERGFNFLSQGNSIKRASYHYDINQDAAMFSRIVQSFDGALFDKLKGSGSDSKTPIFIIGMPRSGTTLVEQIIASHSQVYGAGEGLGLWYLTSELALLNKTRKGFPEGVAEIKEDSWHDLALAYEGSLKERSPDVQFITDKMPHNFLNVGLIHLMFPNATIIHCIRSPIDTCLSIYMQNFTGHHPYAYDLTELGAYYQLYHSLMNHWRQLLPNRMLDIEYEQVVQEPEKMAKKIITSCGLAWEDDCMDFHKSSRAVRTASLVQVRKPIYKSAVGRWRQYAPQLTPLIAALGTLAPSATEEDH